MAHNQQQHQQQQQPQPLDQQQQHVGQTTAFDWHVYSNRRSALLHLRKTHTLADIILQTEDGSAGELVHSQVMSAFGDKLSDYIRQNGHFVPSESLNPPTATTTMGGHTQVSGPPPPENSGAIIPRQQVMGPAGRQLGRSVWQRQQPSREPAERVKSIRLPKLNRYTLHILVECAYTGSICTDLHSGGIWKILELADHYEMQDVIRACCNFLAKNLTQHNCVQFYHVGLKHKHPLMRSAWHTIRANFKHILALNLLHLGLDPNTMEPLDGRSCSPVVAAAAAAAAAAAGGQEKYNCWLATIMFEHYQELLMHDRLNVEREESVWFAIKLWCQFPSLVNRQQQQQPSNRPQVSSLAVALPRSLSPSLPLLSPLPLPLPLPLSLPQPTVATGSAARLIGSADDQDHSGSGQQLQQQQQEQERRSSRVTELLPCMRFARFRTGTEFSTRRIWRDPLIFANKQAQHQLAVLDRNHRDFLSSPTFQGATATAAATSTSTPAAPSSTALATMSAYTSGSNYHHYYHSSRDGFGLPCAVNPRQMRPRVPQSVLLAIGGWQQGQPTKLIESYDLNCNLWFESKHQILLTLAYHGIENVSGTLYICGGTNGNDILNEVFTFDPLTGDCHQAASMREARCYVSTAYLDGYLYAMGGHNGLQRVKSAERLQIGAGAGAGESGQWTHVQDMQVARSDGSACVHGGRIYIAGGLNDQVIESSVEFYNQLDNTWTFVASMITPRTSFTLLSLPSQQSLLAIGGNDGSERLASVERLDLERNTWCSHSQMRHRRSTFSACLLDQTKLIVVGGYNGQTPFNQVEMFDERQNEWVPLKKMRFDRSGLKVVVLNDLANASDYTYLGNAARIH